VSVCIELFAGAARKTGFVNEKNIDAFRVMQQSESQLYIIRAHFSEN